MQHAYKSTDLKRDDRHGNDEAASVAVDTQRRRAAVAGIKALAKGRRLHGAAVRDLIEEGRRF